MLLSSTPTRPAWRGVLRSSEVFRVVPIAAASAWLVVRPPASSFCRFSGFTSLRALSTVATPIASATNKSDDAVVARKSAAELRVLDVLGVVDFVKNELKIDSDDFEKLLKQKIDGAALLETTVDELCGRYGLSGDSSIDNEVDPLETLFRQSLFLKRQSGRQVERAAGGGGGARRDRGGVPPPRPHFPTPPHGPAPHGNRGTGGHSRAAAWPGGSWSLKCV